MNKEKRVDHILLFILKPSAFRRNYLRTKYFAGILFAVYVTDVVVMNEKYSILCKY